MQDVTFPAGELLLREREAGDVAYFIKAGHVEVFRAVDGEKWRLAVLGPGDMVGEMSLVSNTPRSAAAATMGPVTAIPVDREHFQRLMRASPPLVQHILRSLVMTIRSLSGVRDDVDAEHLPDLPLLSERTSTILRREIFRTGRTIFDQGTLGMTAYLIQGGIVGITRADADGTPRILARLGTGRVFGEMALLRNGPRSVTALVLEQAVCEVVSRERFDALMHAAPPLIRHLIEAYVRQIESQTPEDLHRLPAVDHP